MQTQKVGSWLLRVNAALLRRHYEEALAMLTRAAFLYPTSVEVYKLRAETYCKMGDYKSAAVDLKKVLHLFEASVDRRTVAAERRKNSGNSSADEVKEIASIHEQMGGIRVRLANLTDLHGSLLIDQGDYDEASACFDEVIAGLGISAGISLLHRGICHVMRENWHDALSDLNAYFNNSMKEDEISADAWLLWAKLHWKMGYEDGAKEKFNRACEKDPTHEEVVRLTKVLQNEADEACRTLSFDLLSGNTEKATRTMVILSRLASEEKDRQAHHEELRTPRSPQGLHQAALRFDFDPRVKKVIDTPTDIKAIVLRSIAHRQDGKFIVALDEANRAIKLLRKAAEEVAEKMEMRALKASVLMPQLLAHRNAVLRDIGTRAVGEGKLGEALELFNASINDARRNGPTLGIPKSLIATAVDALTLLGRGEIYLALGRLPAAFDDFFGAIMVERYHAQLLSETEGDPLEPLSLGNERSHDRIHYPWLDGLGEVDRTVRPPSLIGVSARTRLALARVHDAVGAQLATESEYAHALRHFSTGIALLCGVCSKPLRVELHLYGTAHRQQEIDASAKDTTGSIGRQQCIAGERAAGATEGDAFVHGCDELLIHFLQRRAKFSRLMHDQTSSLEDLSTALLLGPTNATTRSGLTVLGIRPTNSMVDSEQRYDAIETTLESAAVLAGSSARVGSTAVYGAAESTAVVPAHSLRRGGVVRSSAFTAVARPEFSPRSYARASTTSRAASRSSAQSRRRRIGGATKQRARQQQQQQQRRGGPTLRVAARVGASRGISVGGGMDSLRAAAGMGVGGAERVEWGSSRRTTLARRPKAAPIGSHLAPALTVRRAQR